MDFIGFKKALFEEALAQGCEAAEAYYQRNESFSVNVLEGDIDQYEVNAKGGLNLRVRLGGRNGYAFTQKLEEPEKLVARAMDNARSIEAEDDHPMQGKCEYPALEKPERRAYSLGEQEKIDLALSLERAAKAVDPRVARTEFCTVESGRREIRISNTLGLDAFDEERTAVSVVMPITKEGEDMRNAYAFRIGEGIFDVDGCAREAVADSLALHGASPVGAGTYRALIRNSAMAAMLEAFSPMFSGDNAQKGLTLLRISSARGSPMRRSRSWTIRSIPTTRARSTPRACRASRPRSWKTACCAASCTTSRPPGRRACLPRATAAGRARTRA